MNKFSVSFMFIFIFALAPVAQVKADNLSCLSSSQKKEYEQRFQELMVEADKEVKNPSVAERYIEIQNQKNLALQTLINCDSSVKSEKAQTEACANAQAKFNAQIQAESTVDTEVNSQSAKILNQVVKVSERVISLRNQYPTCK